MAEGAVDAGGARDGGGRMEQPGQRGRGTGEEVWVGDGRSQGPSGGRAECHRPRHPGISIVVGRAAVGPRAQGRAAGSGSGQGWDRARDRSCNRCIYAARMSAVCALGFVDILDLMAPIGFRWSLFPCEYMHIAYPFSYSNVPWCH